ncbi:hypothetical protein FNJ88_08570 [Chryseobacterium sp. SNU WT5]|uniref:hypothetical protein n=1 Tax=Chryseobacterium sp. SNU WT5 TaxID=2594269 RepID=UPI001180733E|nr:hypothetical protein [Chryseobacterium sp. SNU WT5]QDP85614.1 hypothetical protein FNJ88_08570 [Chryseobacterium sp. SNU WT5]
MKKLAIFLLLIIFSCNKQESVSTQHSPDTTQAIDGNLGEADSNSAENGVVQVPTTEKTDSISKIFRVVEGNKIIKTINGDMIPLSIYDEFTSPDEQLIIKIKNFQGKEISGTINPESSKMNIRFNQIKMANGEYDGPFGRELSYFIKENGEIWLIIAKSNMASGEATGKFTVSLR